MITQDELKKYLKYNPDTGLFIWKDKGNLKCKIGEVAGSPGFNGYIRISIKGKRILAHRLAYLYTYGELPTDCVDHVNHDRGDNRLINLRLCSRQENQKNLSKRLVKLSNTGINGVSYIKSRNRFHATISVNSRTVSLGRFKKLSDACLARDAANIMYGFHQNHGKE